jgi:hypothetical protein
LVGRITLPPSESIYSTSYIFMIKNKSPITKKSNESNGQLRYGRFFHFALSDKKQRSQLTLVQSFQALG